MIEALWTLEQAVELIPMPSKKALYGFLNKHPEIPRRYRRSGGPKQARHGFVQRLFTDSEIRLIRDMTINESHGYRFFKGVRRGRPRSAARAQSSLASWIAERASA